MSQISTNTDASSSPDRPEPVIPGLPPTPAWQQAVRRCNGWLRQLRSTWRPIPCDIAELVGDITNSPLGGWLADCRERGMRYRAAWRPLEVRFEQLLEYQPEQIAAPLATQFMDGVETFEFIHVNHRGGRFLSAAAARWPAPRIVEIGTAFGVSGMYLLTGIGHGHLWTFDPCNAWAEVSRANLEEIGRSFTRIGHRFEDAFPDLAPSISPIQLAFVDGLHTFEHVMRQFQLLQPHLAENAMLVFHDIKVNDEMRGAWEEIRRHPAIRCTAFVAGQFGVCEYRGGVNPAAIHLPKPAEPG